MIHQRRVSRRMLLGSCVGLAGLASNALALSVGPQSAHASKRVLASRPQADKRKEKKGKKAQEWGRRDERPESVSFGLDRRGMGDLGAVDPGDIRGSGPCEIHATRDRQWDSLRAAQRLSVEIDAA